MNQDPIKIKEQIVSILSKGPSIPVRIAKEINLSPLFASAFLSELLSEKSIKTSYMKIGGTPIYLIPGQEPKLEPFAEQHLKSKEKEAFLLLKEKKFLKDSEQDPAIRVALRAIRDFAIPFKKKDEIYWRYLTISENEFEEKPEEKKKENEEIITPSLNEEKEKSAEEKRGIKEGQKEDEPSIEPKKEKQELDIFEKEKPKQKKTKKKKPKRKTSNQFFNKVKETLSNKSIELIDIHDFSKSIISLIVKENNQEKLLVAYNKKRITEKDIIKTYEKASKLNLKYILMSKGEPLKKTISFIEAAKHLSKIEKIE